ncbi:MAG: hypothetical protein IPM18_14575 [Phycisphaerales bacterium]|nr:hypothetical protein [Phycisphaerales bacterium]
MRSYWLSPFLVVAAGTLMGLWGCNGGESNPFLTFTDLYGTSGRQSQVDDSGSGGGGGGVGDTFRRTMTLTFRNNHPSAEANTQFIAWVDQSSVRSVSQEDALLRNGYVQLRESVQIGTAHILPVGTYVYGGGGVAGATALVLRRSSDDAGAQTTALPSEVDFTLLTPDAVLVFSQPPVGCDSVAFIYTDRGTPLASQGVAGALGPFEGSTRGGPFKTLAQIDVYQCSPLRPGVFFSRSGAGRKTNEYLEGEPVLFEFNANPTPAGNFAIVTIGTPLPTTGGEG